MRNIREMEREYSDGEVNSSGEGEGGQVGGCKIIIVIIVINIIIIIIMIIMIIIIIINDTPSIQL